MQLHVKEILFLISAISSVTSYASDSTVLTAKSPIVAGVTNGYVLATGVYYPPYPPTNNLSTTLYMYPLNGQQCSSLTTPTVNIAMRSFQTWNNYNISNIAMSTFKYNDFANPWSGYTTATWLGGGRYAIGLSAGFFSDGSSWWSSIGVEWTLYCLMP